MRGACLIFALLAFAVVAAIVMYGLYMNTKHASSGSWLIVFDESHKPMVSISPANREARDPGAYSRLAELLQSLGFKVLSSYELGLRNITLNSLKNVDVLVIVPGDEPYTDEEIRAIVKWVRDGGSLLLLGDYDHYPHNVNPIARRFGFIFASDLYRNAFMNIYEPYNYTFDNLYPVFSGSMLNRSCTILKGVNRVELYSATTIMLLGNSSKDVKYCVFMRTSKNARWYDTLSYDFGPPIPEQPVGIIVWYGRGVVVAIGDVNLWVNHDIDRDGSPSLYDSDNYKLAENVFKFLAEHHRSEFSSASVLVRISEAVAAGGIASLVSLALCAVLSRRRKEGESVTS